MRKRLETIVESKNLTMVNIYDQKPVSVEEMWGLVRAFFRAVQGLYLRCGRLPRQS